MEWDLLFNVRIEALKKKKEKLTVKSGKTGFIYIAFDLADKYAGTVAPDFYRMVLQNPSGGDVEGSQQTTFSTEELIFEAGNTRKTAPVTRNRVNIKFMPDAKLTEGIYTIIIYEGNYIMGSAQVRLIK